MKHTPNYSYKQPERTATNNDPADINVLADNWGQLDTDLNGLADAQKETASALASHEKNNKNPHGMTPEQLGVYTSEAVDRLVAGYAQHVKAKGNVHGASAGDFGAYSVEETNGLIDNLSNDFHGQLNNHVAATGNVHGATAEDIGAYSTVQADEKFLHNSGTEEKPLFEGDVEGNASTANALVPTISIEDLEMDPVSMGLPPQSADTYGMEFPVKAPYTAANKPADFEYGAGKFQWLSTGTEPSNNLRGVLSLYGHTGKAYMRFTEGTVAAPKWKAWEDIFGVDFPITSPKQVGSGGENANEWYEVCRITPEKTINANVDYNYYIMLSPSYARSLGSGSAMHVKLYVRAAAYGIVSVTSSSWSKDYTGTISILPEIRFVVSTDNSSASLFIKTPQGWATYRAAIIASYARQTTYDKTVSNAFSWGATTTPIDEPAGTVIAESLSVDSVPVKDSMVPVTSGGVHTALQGKSSTSHWNSVDEMVSFLNSQANNTSGMFKGTAAINSALIGSTTTSLCFGEWHKSSGDHVVFTFTTNYNRAERITANYNPATKTRISSESTDERYAKIDQNPSGHNGTMLKNSTLLFPGTTGVVFQIYRQGNIVFVNVRANVTSANISGAAVLLDPAPAAISPNIARGYVSGDSGTPVARVACSETQIYFEAISGGGHPTGLATCNFTYFTTD